jgi:hypothetical protein
MVVEGCVHMDTFEVVLLVFLVLCGITVVGHMGDATTTTKVLTRLSVGLVIGLLLIIAMM